MDQVSDAVFWQKPSDFELAANDFYFSLMEASLSVRGRTT